MTASLTPAAMVVLASEQLWPNIHGLVHWQEHASGLNDLCIYYTDDQQRSAQPARRLMTFCRELYPKVRICVPAKALGITPADVQRQIRKWQEELPGRRWVINATGGLKLMFAGALECLELPDTEVVYRELSGDWYHITRTRGGIATQPFAVSAAETDSIPVESLVKAQWRPRRTATGSLARPVAWTSWN